MLKKTIIFTNKVSLLDDGNPVLCEVEDLEVLQRDEGLSGDPGQVVLAHVQPDEIPG